MPSLYQRLSDVAQVNESVKAELINTKGSVRAKLAPYSHSGECFLDALTRLIYELGRAPPIDVPRVQSAILHSPDYEDNKILQQALEETRGTQGEHSLTATLDEAMKVNKGWKILLPRRKNFQHNLVVEELTAILDDSKNKNELEAFRTRGYLIPDNLVMGFIYGLGGFTTAVLGIERLFNAQITYTPQIVGGIISGILCGATVQVHRLVYDRILLMKRTKFIDERIRQLSEVSSTTA